MACRTGEGAGCDRATASLALATDKRAAPVLHSHDRHRNILTRRSSHADEVQPRADVGRVVSDRAATIRCWTVALVQQLACRWVEHDEPAILFHPLSMSRARQGGQCRRSLTLRDLRRMPTRVIPCGGSRGQPGSFQHAEPVIVRLTQKQRETTTET